MYISVVMWCGHISRFLFVSRVKIEQQKYQSGIYENNLCIKNLKYGPFTRITTLVEFFTINNLAVSARSGRSKSEFYVCLSVDTWHLKIQAHSMTSHLPLLVFIITIHISTTSKNYNLYLPYLAETAKFLIAKN